MTDTTQMNKIIRPCAMPMNDGRVNNMAAVYCKIQFESGRLSITGVIGPLRNGNARGGCGQIVMEFAHRNPKHNDKRYAAPIQVSDLQFAAGWTADMWLDFLDVWETWHLNDMQAACEHQRVLGWKYDTHGQVITSYGVAVDPNTGITKTWIRKGECPTCGFRIDSAWLKMDVPQTVIEFLQALPDADMKPTWV